MCVNIEFINDKTFRICMENKLSFWIWKNETWISSFVVSFRNVPTRYPIIWISANNTNLYMSKYIPCDLWLSKRNVSCGSSQRTHSKKFPWDGLVRRSRESFVGVRTFRESPGFQKRVSWELYGYVRTTRESLGSQKRELSSVVG